LTIPRTLADFTSATRRLSELWANVSNRDKNTWRRKAKIEASRAKTRDKTAANGATQPASNGSTALADATQHETIFQNRATTSRTRKLAARCEVGDSMFGYLLWKIGMQFVAKRTN